MATSVPFLALISFCSLAFIVQGMVIGAGAGADPAPCLTDSADPEGDSDPRNDNCESLAGGFFSDLGAVSGFFVDGIVYLFRFLTFDLVPGIPAFIQVPLALICGGGILVVLVWLGAEIVKAIGGLIPFT